MNYYSFLLLLLMTFNGIFSEEKIYFSTADNLRIRENPNDKSRIISKINKNTRIEVLEKSKKVQSIKGFVAHWVKIKLAEEDKIGFIFGAYLKNSKTNREVDFTKCKVNSKGVRIYLNNSKVIFLKNEEAKDDSEASGISFDECNYIPEIDSVLISFGLYEGSGNTLYNLTTGKDIEIWGHPIFSPDNKRFLCMSYDLEAGYVPNGLQIFKVSKNPKKEFEFDFQPDDSKMTTEYGPIDGKWIGNNSIQIIVENFEKTKTKKLIFKIKNNSWKQIENQKE